MNSKNMVGENIAIIRKSRNLTQTELAQLIGTTQSVIGRYERDEMDMSISRLIQIANALSVKPETLFIDNLSVICEYVENNNE